MLLNSKVLIALISFIILSFASCQNYDNVVFDQFIETKGQWEKKDVKTFVYKVTDTISPYNLYMNVRANKDYPYSNMYVIFKVYQPNLSIHVDTLQYQMASADGTLLGNGFSDIKESKLELKEGFVFPQSGTYKMTLEHAVRALGEDEGVVTLPGISEVGLKIEKKE